MFQPKKWKSYEDISIYTKLMGNSPANILGCFKATVFSGSSSQMGQNTSLKPETNRLPGYPELENG